MEQSILCRIVAPQGMDEKCSDFRTEHQVEDRMVTVFYAVHNVMSDEEDGVMGGRPHCPSGYVHAIPWALQIKPPARNIAVELSGDAVQDIFIAVKIR